MSDLLSCLRLTVDSCDGSTVFGRVEGESSPVGQTDGNRAARTEDGAANKGDGAAGRVMLPLVRGEEDWRYLAPWLRAGTRLNVVDGLLILEPDYLVDISAIAACFESYAESPLVHLLNMIRPSATGEAIVLGNLASQLLDEEVHAVVGQGTAAVGQGTAAVGQGTAAAGQGTTAEENTAATGQGTAVVGQGSAPAYADSVRRFFRSHATSLLAADLSPQFHQQGQVQQHNIRRAVREELPRLAGHFDAREVILEPSFYSERLGLQGRMDFLALDYSVVIEQKSGKGGFPEPDADTPVPHLKHYIQLLLYMALLRYQFGLQRQQAFLLYSKYRNALQQAVFSRRMLFRALRVRNGIAAMAHHLARDGFSLLTGLTPAALNERHLRGTLWEDYVRPQLETLLHPLQSCSPLERAYYLRFQQFVATEHLRAKVGTDTCADGCFAAKWRQSLDEKLAAGDILCNLRLVSPRAGDEGRVDEVVLALGSYVSQKAQTTQKELSTFNFPLGPKGRLTLQELSTFNSSNFRQGDIVILYPYSEGTEPDCRQSMVFRCTIARLDETQVTLSLRAAQTDAHVFLRSADLPWAIEHDFMEASFAPLYRGMHAFLSAPQERRDLLLLQRLPRIDTRQHLVLDHGRFNDLALRVKQATNLFLIIGPPGTGKTSFGLMTTLREELTDPGASVLLLSYTNRAVDEVCSKLVEDGVDFLRIGNRLSCDKAYHNYLLENRVQECSNLEQLRQMVRMARVVVGTTTALSAQSVVLGMRHFTLAIIDEASQILEPHLMGLLSAQYKGFPSIHKLVMIGDHKQLPAVVQQTTQESRVEDPVLQAIGLTDCRLSLFERLLKRYARDPQVTCQLTRQGRMHPEIARFPNEAFYGGRLQPVPLPHQLATLPEGAWPRVAFVDVAASEATLSAPTGKVNLEEAAVIARLVREYAQKQGEGFTADKIGIIVPYRNQITAIRQMLRQGDGAQQLETITIDTVERYQGSQRDCIIYGFTVCHPAQLDFLTELCFEEDGHVIDRKLNVAMTRAREHLILVGNARLLSQDPVFDRLIHSVPSFLS